MHASMLSGLDELSPLPLPATTARSLLVRLSYGTRGGEPSLVDVVRAVLDRCEDPAVAAHAAVTSMMEAHCKGESVLAALAAVLRAVIGRLGPSACVEEPLLARSLWAMAAHPKVVEAVLIPAMQGNERLIAVDRWMAAYSPPSGADLTRDSDSRDTATTPAHWLSDATSALFRGLLAHPDRFAPHTDALMAWLDVRRLLWHTMDVSHRMPYPLRSARCHLVERVFRWLGLLAEDYAAEPRERRRLAGAGKVAEDGSTPPGLRRRRWPAARPSAPPSFHRDGIRASLCSLPLRGRAGSESTPALAAADACMPRFAVKWAIEHSSALLVRLLATGRLGVMDLAEQLAEDWRAERYAMMRTTPLTFAAQLHRCHPYALPVALRREMVLECVADGNLCVRLLGAGMMHGWADDVRLATDPHVLQSGRVLLRAVVWHSDLGMRDWRIIHQTSNGFTASHYHRAHPTALSSLAEWVVLRDLMREALDGRPVPRFRRCVSPMPVLPADVLVTVLGFGWPELVEVVSVEI
jgi:hypothetical protein